MITFLLELLVLFLLQGFYGLIDGLMFFVSYTFLHFVLSMIFYKKKYHYFDFLEKVGLNEFFNISIISFVSIRLFIIMIMYLKGLGTVYFRNGSMDFEALNLPGSIFIYVIEMLDFQHVIRYF